MFKPLFKSPLFLLLFFIASFALVGCGDQSQSSAEQAVENTADQAEEAVTEEVEENSTQQ